MASDSFFAEKAARCSAPRHAAKPENGRAEDYGLPHQPAGWFAMTIFFRVRRIVRRLRSFAGAAALPRLFLELAAQGRAG